MMAKDSAPPEDESVLEPCNDWSNTSMRQEGFRLLIQRSSCFEHVIFRVFLDIVSTKEAGRQAFFQSCAISFPHLM